MNYLAHALRFLDQPYALAGSSAPDWLSVADRKTRVRSKHAEPFTRDEDPLVAELARGIVAHHADDAWFHDAPAFLELSWAFTVLVRDALPPDEGFRPSFLGHILVELLLDATLIAERPQRLEAYYASLAAIDPAVVEGAVNRMAPRTTQRLAPLIPLFCRERFLWDYLDDGKLWFRLNQVMRRVGLPMLPESFSEALAEMRTAVAARRDELLPGHSRTPT